MGRRTKRQETAMRNFKIKLDRTVKTALLDGTRPYDAQRILAIAQNRVSAIWRGVNDEPLASRRKHPRLQSEEVI